MNSLKDIKIKEVSEQKNAVKITAVKKPTKGELFKKKHGYSKTFLRNVKKAIGRNTGTILSTMEIETYKKERKARRIAARKLRQKKHEASNTFMRNNGKKRKTKHKGRPKSGASAKPYKAPIN